MIRAQWLWAIWLGPGLLFASAQDGDLRPMEKHATPPHVAPQTERQRWAALTEARRLSEKAEKYEKQGKPDQAERAAEQALALEEQARGPWHIDVAHRLDQVADLYTVHKKEGAAEPLYERARAIRERALSTHPDVYEQDGGELRVRRSQPAEKVGAGQPPPPHPNQ